MMGALEGHPFTQALHNVLLGGAHNAVLNNNGNNNNDSGAAADIPEEEEAFRPPVDVFSTGSGWVLHLALPGARKEDVDVNWNADGGVLTVAGVVHRPGDEEFLSGLVSGERKVGYFRREVRLPPPALGQQQQGGQQKKEKQQQQQKEEINGEGITARMEDGLLVVNVPVVEREWTEVRKVDIM